MASIKVNPTEVVAMQAVSDHTARVLRETVAKIPAKEFDMGSWGPLPDECGTVGCLAAHICLGNGYKPTEVYAMYRKDGGRAEHARSIASRLLKPARPGVLFHLSGWPEQYMRQYYDATSSRQKLAALKRRVEHFIRTGE